MAILASVESELRDEVVRSDWADRQALYYNHDVIIGRLIMARSLDDNEGGLVYVVDGLPHDASELTMQMIAAGLRPENVYRQLLPWFSTKVPSHLETGEPVEITIQHLPDTVVIEKTFIKSSTN